jgi:uncharacterized membrane protein
MKNKEAKACLICKQSKQVHEMIHTELVKHPIIDPSLHDKNSFVCYPCLNKNRSSYVQQMLEQERGELSSLEQEVLKSLHEHEVLSKNINVENDNKTTFGDRISDKVASFGGSWKFIISFFLILVIWIGSNALYFSRSPFDPYPFILLNLILSCIAAIQAPIIMMSQNRQEQKDRLRAEHDYKVNLKAELEIRHLNEKVDYLLTKQWQRLLEIQQIQMDLMNELILQKNKDKTNE